MTHLSSTLLRLGRSSSFLNKASRRYKNFKYSRIIVKSTEVDVQKPSQVHIQTSISLLLLYWLFSWIYRKCLGSVWTFHASRTQRHKDRCGTNSQDNHTCEVCHTLLRWLHTLPKGRGALPEIWSRRPSDSVECRYWQTNTSKKNLTMSSINLGCIVYSTLLQCYPSIWYWEMRPVLYWF